jgi:hypothetical protein
MVPIRKWRHDAYQRYIDVIECFIMMITVYVVVTYLMAYERTPLSDATKLWITKDLGRFFYDMNEINQNDAVAVGGGDGRRGEGVGAQSSTPAVAAVPDADAGSEGGGGAEWQMVTRGKAKAGGLKKDDYEGQAACGECR